jgi:hypothetical protein
MAFTGDVDFVPMGGSVSITKALEGSQDIRAGGY